jgi:8-oxo-dGTP pyrophosphatase MutT (NUDIX family)
MKAREGDKVKAAESRAVVVGLMRDGRVLMLQRKDDAAWEPNSWQQPGGMVEKGESIHRAAERELYEETGVRVRPGDLSFLGIAVYRETDGRDVSVYFFGATDWKGNPRIAEPRKHQAMGWFPLNDMPENTPMHATQIFGNVGRTHFLEMIDGKVMYKAEGLGSAPE